MKIPYLKPTPNWKRIKISDSFLFEMYHWGQTIRHNFKTGEITFYQYDEAGYLTSASKILSREAAIKIIKGYVLWMNRINDSLEWKMTSSNQQTHLFKQYKLN